MAVERSVPTTGPTHSVPRASSGSFARRVGWWGVVSLVTVVAMVGVIVVQADGAGTPQLSPPSEPTPTAEPTPEVSTTPESDEDVAADVLETADAGPVDYDPPPPSAFSVQEAREAQAAADATLGFDFGVEAEPAVVAGEAEVEEPSHEATLSLAATVDPAPAPTVTTASAPTPEPSPEPTAEPTPEPTPDPTPEPTADPTPEPTADPTPDSTPDPTPDPTDEPSDPGLPTAAQWEALRQCEAGGRYDAVNPAGPYYGAYQFSQATWDWVAQSHYPDLVGVKPIDATPAQQDAMALELYLANGTGPWPHCGAHLL